MRQHRKLQDVERPALTPKTTDILVLGAGLILFLDIATVLLLFIFQRPAGPLMNSFNIAVGTAAATVATHAVKGVTRKRLG